MPVTVSLLVPTYNRAEVIAHIWKSWLAQPEVVQLVLVDDGSTQDYRPLLTVLAAACAERGVTLTYLRNDERQGSPAAKNRGIEHCTGEYVLTTDDDIELNADMTHQLLEFTRQHPNAVAGARVVYRRNDEDNAAALARSNGDARAYFRLPHLTLTPWVDTGAPLRTPFVTAVALWPRRYFKQGLRYFTEYGGNGYREETDPQLTVQHCYGAEVWYVPQACCYHLPPRLAYASASGQRRGGRLWFEYWVLRNNVTFLGRHAAYLRNTWNVSYGQALLALLGERFGPQRFKALWRELTTP